MTHDDPVKAPGSQHDARASDHLNPAGSAPAGAGPCPPAGAAQHSLRVDGRMCVLGAVAWVAHVLLVPRTDWRLFAFSAALLLSVALALRVKPALWLRRTLVVLPVLLGLALLVPFQLTASAGGGPAGWFGTPAAWARWGDSAARAWLCAAGVLLVVASIGDAGLLDALHRLRVPPIFVRLLGMTLRYGAVLWGEVRRMRMAARARGWRARNLADAPVIGLLTGSLFLRSVVRGENIHRAMLSRGFQGVWPDPPPRPLTGADVLSIVAFVAALIATRAVLA